MNYIKFLGHELRTKRQGSSGYKQVKDSQVKDSLAGVLRDTSQDTSRQISTVNRGTLSSAKNKGLFILGRRKTLAQVVNH